MRLFERNNLKILTSLKIAIEQFQVVRVRLWYFPCNSLGAGVTRSLTSVWLSNKDSPILQHDRDKNGHVTMSALHRRNHLQTAPSRGFQFRNGGKRIFWPYNNPEAFFEIQVGHLKLASNSLFRTRITVLKYSVLVRHFFPWKKLNFEYGIEYLAYLDNA